MDKPLRLQLPVGSVVIRAGIEPGPGTPAFWFVCDPTQEEKEERYFVVKSTGGDVKCPATHHGMCWEANLVFHLWELGSGSDPSLLVNVFSEEEERATEPRREHADVAAAVAAESRALGHKKD